MLRRDLERLVPEAFADLLKERKVAHDQLRRRLQAPLNRRFGRRSPGFARDVGPLGYRG